MSSGIYVEPLNAARHPATARRSSCDPFRHWWRCFIRQTHLKESEAATQSSRVEVELVGGEGEERGEENRERQIE